MKHRFTSILGSAILLSGCGNAGSPSPIPPLLEPVQGTWRLDDEKTLAVQQAEGVAAAEIAQARAASPASRIHPDMTVVGNVAVLSGFPQGEYRFFALHPHDRWICGKAWHHEDRYDPGDMSKCYVRLEPRDAELRLSLRMEEQGADVDDPDVSEMPITAGSAAQCPADAAREPEWSPWATFVFVKK